MEVLAQIAAWILLITGIIMTLGPILVGLMKKALVGSVNSVEDGKLWFYRHGLGFIIGAIEIAVAAYVISIL